MHIIPAILTYWYLRKHTSHLQPVFTFSGMLFVTVQRATGRDAEKKNVFSAERKIVRLKVFPNFALDA